MNDSMSRYAYSLPRELSRETGGLQGDKLLVVLSDVGLPADDFNPLAARKGKDRKRTFSDENTGCD